MLYGYLAVSAPPNKRFTTKNFNQGIVQFHRPELIKTSSNSERWLFELHNKAKHRISNQALATHSLNITQMILLVNKPKVYGLKLNEAKLLIELKFLQNEFIARPEGVLTIEFLNVFFFFFNNFWVLFVIL